MGQTARLGKTFTTVTTNETWTHIQYHQTVVVSFSQTCVILRTGGWKTATTKLRMNQASRQFNLGYEVSQRKGTWYVSQWDAVNQKWINEKEFIGEQFIIPR